jgi:uncharacterized membrane protein
MSDSFPVFRLQGIVLFIILSTLLALTLVFLFVGVTESAFEAIGFTRAEFAAILVATFLGSAINIPITRVSGNEPITGYREVRFYGFTYRIPVTERVRASTLVTVNVGGALIPILVSAYLLITNPNLASYSLVGVIVTSVLVHLMARKVKGEGIETPALLPPLVAAVASVLIHPSAGIAVIAYVSGSMGALIGADLTNLKGITDLGAPMVSIGGAGTLDGVFLTGILAVILVSIF